MNLGQPTGSIYCFRDLHPFRLGIFWDGTQDNSNLMTVTRFGKRATQTFNVFHLNAPYFPPFNSKYPTRCRLCGFVRITCFLLVFLTVRAPPLSPHDRRVRCSFGNAESSVLLVTLICPSVSPGRVLGI